MVDKRRPRRKWRKAKTGFIKLRKVYLAVIDSSLQHERIKLRLMLNDKYAWGFFIQRNVMTIVFVCTMVWGMLL